MKVIHTKVNSTMSSRVALQERLIECVRLNEILYNTDEKGYSDTTVKLKIWGQIALKCGMRSGDDARKQWKNLRDGYRWAIKNYNSIKSKDPTKKPKRWKHFEQMSFLRPHMNNRERSANLGYESDACLQTFDTELDDNTQDTVKEEHVDETHFVDVAEDPINPIPQEEKLQFEDDTAAPTKKTRLSVKDVQFGVKRKQTKRDGRWHMRRKALKAQENSLKLFFDSMYASTKKLSPSLQRKIKTKLFQAVTDAEASAEANHQLESRPDSVLSNVSLEGSSASSNLSDHLV